MALDKEKIFASLDENGLVENYSSINYSHVLMDCSAVNNSPGIGATYDAELNAFVPPQPPNTDFFSTETYQWEIDPNVVHNVDGVDCRWSPKLQGWIVLENWSDEEHL